MYLVTSKSDKESIETAKTAISYLKANKLKYALEKEIFFRNILP